MQQKNSSALLYYHILPVKGLKYNIFQQQRGSDEWLTYHITINFLPYYLWGVGKESTPPPPKKNQAQICAEGCKEECITHIF